MPQPLHLQSHPLWQVRRRVTTIAGLTFTRPVLRLGEPLNLHGPDESHVLANANAMGFSGDLYAVLVQS